MKKTFYFRELQKEVKKWELLNDSNKKLKKINKWMKRKYLHTAFDN